jgi:membrane fusion protein (multidrug efflux system)
MLQKRIILATLFLLIAIGLVYGFKFWQALQGAKFRGMKRPPATVATEAIKLEHWKPRIRSVGTLNAKQGIVITAETAGKIIKIHFKSGDKVKKGAILVSLDDEVDQAALAVLKAKSRLAQIQYRRAANLLPSKAVSKSAYDEAKAAYDQTQAEVRQQQALIDRKQIKAPFDGKIGIQEVYEGDYIKAGDRITKLQTDDQLYLDYWVPERFAHRIRLQQTVEVYIDYLPGQKFTAVIDSIDPGIDIKTRTRKVRAVIDNQEQKLLAGMFAEIYTIIGEQRPVITVPSTAIVFKTYGEFAYVVKQDKEKAPTVERRSIVRGRSRKGRVEIIKGLKKGEVVVVAGVDKLRNGSAIKVNNSVVLKHSKITTE